LQSERRTESGTLEKLNSEQLQVVIDENPTCTTRELSKSFSVSHMATYREMKRLDSLKGWETPFPPPPFHTHTTC
ncbi:unnamed protein product, partial [Hymenolepis diminuta]